jgi:hypothetical protein
VDVLATNDEKCPSKCEFSVASFQKFEITSFMDPLSSVSTLFVNSSFNYLWRQPSTHPFGAQLLYSVG